MYARLILYSDGQTPPTYEVNMVNYSVVSVDYDNLWAVVSFGPRDAPPSMPQPGTPLYPLEGDKYVLIGLTPDQMAAWWARLAARYPGHEPPYQPDFP